jgi:RND family efflux transporter MFP subunit
LNEIVALKRAGVSAELLDAARERTRALSIPAELVREAEAGGRPEARYALRAPASGVVAELGVREGVAVSPGMTLFRIAGLEKVWAVAEVPEAQAVHLVRGQKVKAVLQADASQTFSGEMKEILPQVNASTRTLQARFEVDNKGGRLVPGMLLRLQVAGPTVSRLVVPAEAVIRSGTRAVAIVRKDNGSFEPREVMIGADLGDTLEIVQGLNEGDQVVASGQFLVDSEARLRSVLGSMAVAQPAPLPRRRPSVPRPEPPGDCRPDPLVRGQPGPGPDRDRVPGRCRRPLAVRTPLDALPTSPTRRSSSARRTGKAPQVVEDLVTYPLTTTMLSVPGARRSAATRSSATRSSTCCSTTRPTVLGALARQYPNQVSRLPAGANASLGPDATGVGWGTVRAGGRSGRNDIGHCAQRLVPEVRAEDGPGRVGGGQHRRHGQAVPGRARA